MVGVYIEQLLHAQGIFGNESRMMCLEETRVE
jgi:hypothetical protein